MPMISSLFITFFRISITTGVLILLLYGLGSLLDRFYAAGWKCWLWLLLAVRLMIPFAPSFPGAPVYLNVNVNGSDAGVVQQILKNVQEGLQIRGETGQIHSENGQPEQENGQLLSKDVQPFQKNNLSDQKNGLPDQENGRQLSDNLQQDRENGSAPVQSITVWVNALLPLIWILGILIFSLYQFIKYHVYRKQIIRWSHGVRNPVISGKLEQLKKQMHIMGEISVLVSSRADSPMIIGLIHPALVLPYETYTDQELHIYLTDFYNMLLSDSRKEAERDDFTGINGYILEKQLVFTRESYNKSQGGICRVQLQEATVKKFTDNSAVENANGNGSMEGESVKAEVYVKYSFAWGDGSAQNRTSVGDLLKVTLTEHDGSYKILDLESTSVETQMVKEEIQSILEKHGEQASESYDGVDRYFEDLISSLP